jgi:GTP-binding protein
MIGNVSLRILPTDRPDTWEVQAAASCSSRSSSRSCAAKGSSSPSASPRSSPASRRQAARADRALDDRRARGVSRAVTQLLRLRKGRLEQMVNHGTGWVRLDYIVPARGSSGSDRVPHRDPRHRPHAPRVRGLRAVARRHAHAPSGSLVADRTRRDDPYAMQDLQERGRCSSSPVARSTRA